MRWSGLLAVGVGLCLPLLLWATPGNVYPPEGACTVHGDSVVLRWGFSPLLDEVLPPGRSILVSRDNEVIAVLPSTATSYVDREVPPGKHRYVVSAQMGDPVVLLLECTVIVPRPYPPPQNLTCDVVCQIGPVPLEPVETPQAKEKSDVSPDPEYPRRYCNVILQWENPVPYAAVVVLRDGRCRAVLPGAAERYVDIAVSPGEHRYRVAGIPIEILPEPAAGLLDNMAGDPAGAGMPEILPIVCPEVHDALLSNPCTVTVPPIGPVPGPSDLTCVPIEVRDWRDLPELGQIPADDLPKLPFRGVLLIWRNNARYDSIVIERDGETIARIPGRRWYYLDAAVPAGKHQYLVRGVVGDNLTGGTRCVVVVPGPQELPPPYDLACSVICPIIAQDGQIIRAPECPDCPLRCIVSLRWRNGARYERIAVWRDGDLLEVIPGDSTRYVDRTATAGVHVYAVSGRRSDEESKKTRCSVVVPSPWPILPPQNLVCRVLCEVPIDGGQLRCQAKLSWENPQEYDEIVIVRDGEVLATLPGDAESYLDEKIPQGEHVYGVSGRVGDLASRPALCRAVAPPPPLRPPRDLVCLPGGGPQPLPPIVEPNQREGEIPIPIPINVVLLRWRNGSTYDAVIIRRDGEQIAKLPGSSEQYTDMGVPAGEHTYAVSGIRDGVETAPATCTVLVGLPVPPPTGLTCTIDPDDPAAGPEPGFMGITALLAWENPPEVAYDRILVFRNGSLVAKLPGDTTRWRDRGLLPGRYVYGVAGVLGGRQSIPAWCKLLVPGPFPPPQDLTCNVIPVPCPPPLECARLAVELKWRNPVGYLQILIFRNGRKIAELPGGAERYVDRTPEEKTLKYEVKGVAFDGSITDPAVCTVELVPTPAPPSDLACNVSGRTVELTWTNGQKYDKIVIVVNPAVEVEQKAVELPGDATSHTFEDLTPGRWCFAVYGVVEDRRSPAVRCCVLVEGGELKNVLYFGPVSAADVPVGVAVCVADNKDPLEAWSFGVCNDPTQIRPVDATTGGTFVGGLDLGFLAVSVYEEGVTMAAIVQPVPKAEELPPEDDSTAIEPGRGRTLLKITYQAPPAKDEIIEPPPELYPIRYCSRLGDPPVSVLFVVDGIEVKPATVPGFVRIPSGKEFVRGDANADGVVDIADAIFLLNYLFAGGDDPPCMAAADANGTREVNIADAVFLLNMLFGGGPQPPAPYPDCGPYMPRRDRLSCEVYEACPER